MAALVLDPPELATTAFAPDEILAGPHADGHVLDGDVIRRQEPLFLPRNSDPDGGLWSTTRDQLRFARFHLGDGTAVTGSRLLHPYALELMRSPQVAIPGLPLWIGMNWFVLDQLGLRFVTHSGDASGQHAELWMIPAREFALVLLTNALPGGAAMGGPVLLKALSQYLGIDATVTATPTAPRPTSLAPEELAEYAGRYTVPNATFILRQIADRLVLSVEAHPMPDEIEPLVPETVPSEVSLQRVGEDLVAAPEEGLQLAFVRQPDGQVGWIASGGRLALRVASA